MIWRTIIYLKNQEDYSAMNEPKAFETSMSGGTGLKGILADPLSLATKPPVIFKFASAVSNQNEINNILINLLVKMKIIKLTNFNHIRFSL